MALQDIEHEEEDCYTEVAICTFIMSWRTTSGPTTGVGERLTFLLSLLGFFAYYQDVK